ncbi:hypothetical protein [Chryseobacterium sp. MEBOG07]|uniref:hypothetical protein n=1 Tax=Chryseobacterium sp. MEBOG07 TaxID=2879939 RepID=UPI001F4774FC|nr:hypothetical protein [Chryseobacterium sp. MEBOG07]UKB77599.1 hypothetical protein LF886_13965 [Chryseobacterium sp. MEBOG07]
MKHIKYIILILFSINCLGQKNCKFKINEATILKNENLDYFIGKMQKDQFETQTRKQAIPSYIKKELDCLSGDFSIANPDKEYQSSCIYEKNMPRRQLLFLAKSKDILILTYATGGIGSTTHFLFIKYDSKQILDLWTGVTMGIFKPESLKSIIKYIQSNRDLDWELNTNMISI